MRWRHTLFFSHRVEEMEARADEALAAAKRAGSETLRLDTMGLMALKHLCYGELALRTSHSGRCNQERTRHQSQAGSADGH